MRNRVLQFWALMLMAVMAAPVLGGSEDQQGPREMYPVYKEPVAPVVTGKLKWVEPPEPQVEQDTHKPGNATYRGTRGHGFTLDPQGQESSLTETLGESDEFRKHPKPRILSHSDFHYF